MKAFSGLYSVFPKELFFFCIVLRISPQVKEKQRFWTKNKPGCMMYAHGIFFPDNRIYTQEVPV